jgi:hypothetical protein
VGESKGPDRKQRFQGGFLGLDNIGIFDRSQPLPTGGFIEQADGTAWMAFYCQIMLAIALELAHTEPLYEELAAKFLEQGLRIVAAMDRMGDLEEDLWDEEDGFFYDVLRLPDGTSRRLKVRSLVGLLALCATVVVLATVAAVRADRSTGWPNSSRFRAVGDGSSPPADYGTEWVT